MRTPDQRARDQDRSAAIEAVQAAWADGQIVEADRDKRVEELQRAQTLGEVQMLVHDLEPRVIVDLVQKVRRKLPDETSYYAVVRAPDEDRAVVWAYATNEYHDTVYLGARRDGTITWDSTEH